jgi:hypothetical protein
MRRRSDIAQFNRNLSYFGADTNRTLAYLPASVRSFTRRGHRSSRHRAVEQASAELDAIVLHSSVSALVGAPQGTYSSAYAASRPRSPFLCGQLSTPVRRSAAHRPQLSFPPKSGQGSWGSELAALSDCRSDGAKHSDHR